MSILNIDTNTPLVQEQLQEFAKINVHTTGIFIDGAYITNGGCWYGTFPDIDLRIELGKLPADWTKEQLKNAVQQQWRHDEKIYFQFSKPRYNTTTIYVYIKRKFANQQRQTVATIKIRLKYDWELKDEYHF